MNKEVEVTIRVGCYDMFYYGIVDCSVIDVLTLSVQLSGKIKLPGAPCKFSATPSKVTLPAPLLGEHNSEVYCRMLGYAQEKLDKMMQAGTI